MAVSGGEQRRLNPSRRVDQAQCTLLDEPILTTWTSGLTLEDLLDEQPSSLVVRNAARYFSDARAGYSPCWATPRYGYFTDVDNYRRQHRPGRSRQLLP